LIASTVSTMTVRSHTLASVSARLIPLMTQRRDDGCVDRAGRCRSGHQGRHGVSDVAAWWRGDRVTLGWLHARRGNTMGVGEGQHWLLLPFKEASRKALLEQESRQMEACGGMAGTGNERSEVESWTMVCCSCGKKF
jgi:hypothetical protein